MRLHAGMEITTQPRVLVVEDQDIIQDLLLTVFGRAGFPTTCAGTVAEALAALDDEPDFVVLDLHLPDGRGTDVLRRIRELSLASRVAVTTGALDADLTGAARHLNPDRMFQKPYRVGELVEWIRAGSSACPRRVLAAESYHS
jgi:DNA-binding response OmpR family regulator